LVDQVLSRTPHWASLHSIVRGFRRRNRESPQPVKGCGKKRAR
jgi:hypothetical protein